MIERRHWMNARWCTAVFFIFLSFCPALTLGLLIPSMDSQRTSSRNHSNRSNDCGSRNWRGNPGASMVKIFTCKQTVKRWENGTRCVNLRFNIPFSHRAQLNRLFVRSSPSCSARRLSGESLPQPTTETSNSEQVFLLTLTTMRVRQQILSLNLCCDEPIKRRMSTTTCWGIHLARR